MGRPLGKSVRLAAAALCVAASVPFAPATATSTTAPGQFDYARISGLSQPMANGGIRTTHMLPMADGVEVYVEVTRPKITGRVPVIAEISPYHGTIYQRDGQRMMPGAGFRDYFVPRGYAVLMMDVRGTGRSQGCLDLMGPKDQSDAKRVIEWAARQPWSNGRVGVMGHSYPGGTSVMSLAQRPKGLVTAVVSAGLGSMYEHQFQAGVPYNLQWAGPYIGYYPLSLERHLPLGIPFEGSGNGGDNLGNDMEYFGCGVTQMPFTEGERQLSGAYGPWHAARDFRRGAAANLVPVFVMHGVNDQAARIASMDWFFRRSGATGDKLWIGQWDHGIGCCPNRRGKQGILAMHAWFDKQLQQRNVATGPPVEVFLSDGSEEHAISGGRTSVFTPPKYGGSNRLLTFYPDASGSMSSIVPKVRKRVAFDVDPFGYFARETTQGEEFMTRPLDQDLVMVGVPRLRLAVSTLASRVHVIASLYDQAPDGSRRRISQFAMNPELRGGLASPETVIPGRRYVISPPGFAMAHDLRTGHRLVMRITSSDPDKVPFFAASRLTVFTGGNATALQVPVVDHPVLLKDSVSLK